MSPSAPWGSPFIFTITAGNNTGLLVAFSLAQNQPNPLTVGTRGIVYYGQPSVPRTW